MRFEVGFPVPDPEFFPDIFSVFLDGLAGQVKRMRYYLCGSALPDEIRHLNLCRREAQKFGRQTTCKWRDDII
jgi:hypothetical protein